MSKNTPNDHAEKIGCMFSAGKRTAELATDYVEMTGQIVKWAREQGARVQPRLVEALHDELKGNARALAGGTVRH